jgi:4-hydroxybenzoyl-CoA reductase subunit beta
VTLPFFAWREPSSVAEACRWLAEEPDARVLAGGTDLLVSLRNGQKKAGTLIDLSKLPDLRAISYDARAGLRIGALATLREVADDARVRALYPAVAQAAAVAGSPQLKAMASIGGNLCQDSCCMYFNRPEGSRLSLEPCHKLGGCVCHVVASSPECWATYCGDLAPALLALAADVTCATESGSTTRSLESLYTGLGTQPHALSAGEILTDIRLPPHAAPSGSVYVKLRQREAIDYPLAGAAAAVWLDQAGERCLDVAVALTAVDRAPVLLDTAPWRGGPIGQTEIAAMAGAAERRAEPVKNVAGAAVRYRGRMVRTLTRDALERALDAARREGGTCGRSA